MYLPLHHGPGRNYFLRIRVTKLGFFTVSLPLFAFITCVLLTMYKNFKEANNTHCNVPNIFPSISASIGNFEPQSTIWKAAIYIHAPIRFYIIYLRWDYYRTVIRDNCIFVVKFAVLLNITENLALLGLTYWTSSLNYPYHEVCFKTFIGTSIFYMFFTCIMLTRYRRKIHITSLEKHSVKLKWRSFIVNIFSFSLAAYFFLRHNRYCEPYDRTKVVPAWVVELETRHIAAEEKLANAAMIIAEAARTNAETGGMNAETARINAECARMHCEVMVKVIETLSEIFSLS